VILAVGGFDPSGRAGLLADAWAIRCSAGSMVGVVSALTAQGKVFHCAPVAPKTLGFQISAVLGPQVRAVKVGMVPSRRSLEQILGPMPPAPRPIVIDPVVRTSRGEPLSTLTSGDYLRAGKQFGRGRRLVLTPNRDELSWLGVSPQELLRLGFWAVVVKGSESGVDEVFSGRRQQTLRGSRLPRNTSHHRGTGCRFASGLATHLACGEDLFSAVRSAKRLVRKFLSDSIIH
jgi:hydroxymethylpyrimidine/phosphomethylpyrimidine kinase